MPLRVLPPLLALAGCATAAPPHVRPAGPDIAGPVWQALLQSAATQVRRCYRGPPRVGPAGRRIVTRLRVFVSPAGVVQGRPTVIAQEGVTPLNRLYADRMAEAAIQSVLRCAPLRLPEGFANEAAFEIDLTFSPLAAA